MPVMFAPLLLFFCDLHCAHCPIRSAAHQAATAATRDTSYIDADGTVRSHGSCLFRLISARRPATSHSDHPRSGAAGTLNTDGRRWRCRPARTSAA